MYNCVLTLIITLIVCSVMLCCLSSTFAVPPVEGDAGLGFEGGIVALYCSYFGSFLLTSFIIYSLSSIIPILSCAFVNRTTEIAILLFSFMLCCCCMSIIAITAQITSPIQIYAIQAITRPYLWIYQNIKTLIKF